MVCKVRLELTKPGFLDQYLCQFGYSHIWRKGEDLNLRRENLLNRLAICHFKPTQPPFQKTRRRVLLWDLNPLKILYDKNFINHYKYCCLTCVFTMDEAIITTYFASYIALPQATYRRPPIGSETPVVV